MRTTSGNAAMTPASRKKLLALAGLACGWGVSSPAIAQDWDPFSSIVNRPQSDYTPPPIIVGGLEVVPRINADIEFVDNIFASDFTDVDDIVLAITPGVSVRDRRTDRQVSLNIKGGYESYLKNEIDDRFTLQAQGQARLGIGTLTRTFIGFDVNRNNARNLRLSDLSDVAQPLQLFSYGGNFGVERDFGPISTMVEAQIRKTEYDGEVLINGVSYDGGFRDYENYAARVRVGYSRNPAQRFYVEGSVNARDYSNTAALVTLPGTTLADRSSDGYSVRIGYARQLTELLLLDVNAGYLRQEYDDPALQTVSGFSFDGAFYYSPTRLTRLFIRGSRSIDQSVNPLYSGRLRTEFALGIEHELQRNLVLSGEGRYAVVDLGSTVADGSEWVISGSARYYVTPNISFRIRGEHFERNTNFPGSQSRALFGIQYTF